MAPILNVEHALVCHEDVRGEAPEGILSLCAHLSRGEYLAVLAAQPAQRILEHVCANVVSKTPEELEKGIIAAVQATLPAGSSAVESQVEVAIVGIAALRVFMQANWCGPPIPAADTMLSQALKADVNVIDLLQHFISDGEVMYRWVAQPLYLLLAKAILVKSAACFPDMPSLPVHTARVLNAQQKMMDNTSATLHDALTAAYDAALACEALKGMATRSGMFTRLWLELGLAYHFYSETSRANTCFQEAQRSVGLEVALTGAMGKRTRFQDAKAQLVLQVGGGSTAEGSAAGTPAEDAPYTRGLSAEEIDSYIPPETPLQDDTLLPQTQYEEDMVIRDLAPWEQATLLALCLNVSNQNPRHGLTTEEMFPYCNYVLAKRKDWGVQLMALLTKSRLEKEKIRTVTRSTVQLSNLTELFAKEAPNAAERMRYLTCLNIPPTWLLHRELGQRYVALTLHRDALEIFQRLELWEGVIGCHQALSQDEKAEELVRKRLAEEPTPTLWCVLGDITRKEEYYEKAWELSNHKLTRAPRSLGRKLLLEAEMANNKYDRIETETYKRCIDCFERCLTLNTLQADVWFSLGCAAQRIDDFERAARAFRRKVEIDDEDFESWNNLANAYLKIKQPVKAFYAFLEATKRNFENWKIWENYSAVAAEVNAYSEVIRAVIRIVELRKQYNDWRVLRVAVEAVIHDMDDASGTKAGRLKEELGKTLSMVKGSSITEFRVWSVCAIFHAHYGEHDQATNCRRSAYQLAKSQKGWEHDDTLLSGVVETVVDMVKGGIDAGNTKEMSAALLTLRSTIKSIETVIANGAQSQVMNAKLAELKTLLETLDAAIAAAKAKQ